MSDVSLKVEIAGGFYSLKLKAEDESSVKLIVEIINGKISDFEKKFGIKDKKDVLAMVSLQYLSELMKEKNTAEKELSTLKLVFEDVKEQLVQHKENISRTTGQ
jgi:cell division protein ZapA (FtsZ GTPase activity inhibitor)